MPSIRAWPPAATPTSSLRCKLHSAPITTLQPLLHYSHYSDYYTTATTATTLTTPTTPHSCALPVCRDKKNPPVARRYLGLTTARLLLTHPFRGLAHAPCVRSGAAARLRWWCASPIRAPCTRPRFYLHCRLSVPVAGGARAATPPGANTIMCAARRAMPGGTPLTPTPPPASTAPLAFLRPSPLALAGAADGPGLHSGGALFMRRDLHRVVLGFSIVGRPDPSAGTHSVGRTMGSSMGLAMWPPGPQCRFGVVLPLLASP